MTPRVCFILLIIQQPGVNYSAYTMVATPQDIHQMIYDILSSFCTENAIVSRIHLFRISSNAIASTLMQIVPIVSSVKSVSIKAYIKSIVFYSFY